MPDYAFISETGQPVRLADYNGRPYAFTFIFTRCPFPTFCPRMSTRLNEAYQALKSNPAAPEGWHFFSITIDPEFDTPEVMRQYAQAYTYDPDRWNYLTGKLVDITALGEQFGLQFYMPEPGQPGGINHNLRTVIVNTAGRVQAILIGNEWTAEDLIREIRGSAAP
jgi:protein SCO1/2